MSVNPGGLRTSDADRAQVLGVLQAASAEGRISYEEHADRSAAALQARTFDDLVRLTDDLVPRVPPVPAPAPAPAATDRTDQVTAVLSSGKRVGPWRVTRSTTTTVVLGDVLLDLTEATFEAGTVEISCSTFLGSTKIRVPLGTNVRMEVANVLSDSSVRDIGDPDPAMPTVIVRGVNFLGDVQVRGPKKPLPWKRHVT